MEIINSDVGNFFSILIIDLMYNEPFAKYNFQEHETNMCVFHNEIGVFESLLKVYGKLPSTFLCVEETIIEIN